MTVTITNIGTNSRQIDIVNEYDAGNIINAVGTCITSLGWTEYDTVSSGFRNCMSTKVYSAPNNDDAVSPTTKYMILRFDSPNQFWYVSCAESWNATTHVATNECWNGQRNFPLPLQYSNSSLYVFATARYAMFCGAVRGEVGPWQGIFEFERQYPDTAANGYPCFGYTNSIVFGSPYYGYNDSLFSTSSYHSPLWLPRTRNGYTGIGAARQHNWVTGYDTYPDMHYRTAVGTSVTNQGGGITGLSPTTAPYPKKVFTSPRIGGIYDYIPFGRIYGLKVISRLGNNFDTVSVPVDADGFANTYGGTPTQHYIFGLTGGSSGGQSPVSMLQSTTGGLLQETYTSSTFSATQIYRTVLVNGRYFYSATASANVCKYDIETGLWSNIAVPNLCENMIFDGNANLYVGTQSGVTRINTVTDATANLSVGSGGVSAMAVDDNFLYVGDYNTSNAPACTVILANTFASARSNTIAVNNTSYSNFDTADYDGNVYASTYTTSGTLSYFVRYTGSNALRSNVILPPAWAASSSYTSGVSFYDGVNFNIQQLVVSITNSPPGCLISKSLTYVTANANVDPNATRVTTIAYPVKTYPKTVPFRGYRICQFHTLLGSRIITRFGLSLTGNTVSFETNTTPANRNSITNNWLTSNGAMFTDGVNLYGFLTTGNAFRIYKQQAIYDNFGVYTAQVLIPS